MDVMIDLETMGLRAGCAILSIGAVTFSNEGLGATFHKAINLRSCTSVGLTIDADTVNWWMGQSDAARKAAFPADAQPLNEVLIAFWQWYRLQGGTRIWAHGAASDIPWLEAAYDRTFLQAPWVYHEARCARTLYSLADAWPDESKGTLHNALDDATNQAEAAIRALRKLGLWPTPRNRDL